MSAEKKSRGQLSRSPTLPPTHAPEWPQLVDAFLPSVPQSADLHSARCQRDQAGDGRLFVEVVLADGVVVSPAVAKPGSSSVERGS